MVKPTLTVLEACHRLALSEGRKENKREMKMVATETLGRIIEKFEKGEISADKPETISGSASR